MAGNLIIRIELPEWDPEDPTYWFSRAEGNFELLKKADGSQLTLTNREKLTLVGNTIPAEVMKRYKADVIDNDYEAFKNTVCGAASRTDAQLFGEVVTAKIKPGQKPSEFIQDQRIRLGLLETVNRDNWILKQTLERQMPAAIKAAMARVPYDEKNPREYLGHIDTISTQSCLSST